MRDQNPNLQNFVTHTPDGQRMSAAFRTTIAPANFMELEAKVAAHFIKEIDLGHPDDALTYVILGGLPPRLLITGDKPYILEAIEILDNMELTLTYENCGPQIEVWVKNGLNTVRDPIAALKLVVQYLRKHVG